MSRPQSLQVQLTPMQVPDANPVGVQLGWPDETRVSGSPNGSLNSALNGSPDQQLKIIPGEPSELVVQVHNTSSRPLTIAFHVSGDFPQQWCQVGTEGHELPAGQRTEAVLYFNIAADFFEDRQALQPNQQQTINYQGQVQIYAGANDANHLMAAQTFSLHVRPHSRYLKFLPAVYHEVDFIGRFLQLFEQSFDPATRMLTSMWAYLDPLTAPEALLPFLAQWVGWPVDGRSQINSQISSDASSDVTWSPAQQRKLIRRAMEIYRWRGTRKGLRLYLHLYTGLPLEEESDIAESEKQISIQEIFSRGFLIGSSHLNRENARLGGGRPFHFTVRLRSPRALDKELIHKIIAQEKPAFCTYDLLIEHI